MIVPLPFGGTKISRATLSTRYKYENLAQKILFYKLYLINARHCLLSILNMCMWYSRALSSSIIILYSCFIKHTAIASQNQCVRGTARIAANAPANCHPGYQRTADVRGSNVADTSHQCKAAKARAEELVKQDQRGPGCDVNVQQVPGNCVHSQC